MTNSTTADSRPENHVGDRHAGKVALVTGGARGIGAGIVGRLAAKDARVTFTYDSATDEAEALVSTITDFGGQAAGINANSSDRAQVREVIADLAAQEGRLDIVESNAGGGTKKRVGELSDDEIDRMIDVNIRGTLDTVRFSAPPAGRRSGHRDRQRQRESLPRCRHIALRNDQGRGREPRARHVA